MAVAEPRPTRRALYWLLFLGPFFFASYGLSNWLASQRSDVGSIVFGWEQAIPLWPWTIVPYWSIDLLYAVSLFLCVTRRELDALAKRLLTAQIVAVVSFLLFPLRFTFQRPPLDGVFGTLFDVLMGFDKPFNQAPSLHIALLVIIWLAFARHVRGTVARWLMHGWFALIGLSVLTTWQHHFIDIPTGALLGWLCVWLWPDEDYPVSHGGHWRLAGYYTVGALLLAGLAIGLGGWGLWWFWPAVSLALVAANYAWRGVAGFQKQANGRLSAAVYWLFAPYLLGAWINSRLWTRRASQPVEIADGVWLGRIPTSSDLKDSRFSALVDLCAELPVSPQGQVYHRLPVLDLTVADSALCLAAAGCIEQSRTAGPVLVFCALGVSRSALAVAAWLLFTGRAADAEQALAMLRRAKPQVHLSVAHAEVLLQMQKQMKEPDRGE